MSQISMASMAHADPRILAEGAVKKTDSPEKIKDAAQQFEGLLLSQILSTVHEDGGWLGSGSDSSSDAAASFAEQQLAGMIAQKGGLGLSGMISAGLQRQSAGVPAPPISSSAPGVMPLSHP
jgi:Rod binding domain-containing protein